MKLRIEGGRGATPASLLRRAAEAAAAAEGISLPCVVQLTLTDDATMRGSTATSAGRTAPPMC